MLVKEPEYGYVPDPLGAGAVTVIDIVRAVLPGLRVPPPYWQELPTNVGSPHGAPAPHAVTDHPAGAINVNPVRANWLLAGLERVNEIAVDTVPFRGAPTVIATVGKLAFAA